MRTILSIIIFSYCLSFGFWFIGYTLNLPSITGLSGINFSTAANATESIADNTKGQANFFGVVGVFGDFITTLNVFWQMVSLGPLLNMMQSLGLPSAFVLPMQVICTVFLILGLLYVIGGRGTDLSMAITLMAISMSMGLLYAVNIGPTPILV